MTDESTETDQTRLSEKQHLAIDLLMTGGTHREAAEATGVARTTVTEWVNHRSEFRRELERRRWQRAEQVNDRVSALTTRALDVIEQPLVAGDLRAALGVLPLPGGATPGTDTASHSRAARGRGGDAESTPGPAGGSP